MQRSYPLRWLALAIGLLGTQCLDSISDDCTKTLTCDQPPTLGPDCVWRYPDQRVWEGGPTFDTRTQRWRWPDGKETATQDLQCDQTSRDAGVDGGTGPDCRLGTLCDNPLVCDDATGACVECVSDNECSGNMPMGDAGAANVCDTERHDCVRCMQNSNCSGDTPFCKTDATNSANNECVECTGDGQCAGDTPVCDETTNECTVRCTTPAECSGDKPVCNVAREVCVECLDAAQCTGDTKKQCNITTNECVECLDDSPCAAAGKVCDTTQNGSTSNTCVQCRLDVQCQNSLTAAMYPYCDTETSACVACLNDLQCTSEATSRCNSVLHICTGCTDSNQCENGFLCNGGACVECVDNSSCTNGDEPFCETSRGQCVECLDANSSECLTADAAHCATEQNADPRYVCTGCESNQDCANKPNIGGLCRSEDGVCVDCITNAECNGDSTHSKCVNGGTCEVCTVDNDCSLFGTSSRPNCKTGEGCVECVDSADCSGNTAEPVCKTVNGGGPAAINTCVECVANTDCRNPAESVCNNNQCVPCTQDAQCSHIDSNGATAGGTPLNVCDTGTCVQCTGPKRAACANNTVCDSLARTCSTRVAASADQCDDCVSDAECQADSRCVQQVFAGQNLGYFCFPLAAGNPAACPARIFLNPVSSPTIDAQTPTPTVCQPPRTTCAGLADYSDATECDGDTDCGAASVADGICDDGLEVCTVPCNGGSDCAGSCDIVSGACEL